MQFAHDKMVNMNNFLIKMRKISIYEENEGGGGVIMDNNSNQTNRNIIDFASTL